MSESETQTERVYERVCVSESEIERESESGRLLEHASPGLRVIKEKIATTASMMPS